MNYTIVLTCEYIFDDDYCITYLNNINVDSKQYEYVYTEYHINDVVDKKRIRKLLNVLDTDLSMYPNIMRINFDNNFNDIIRALPVNLSILIFSNTYNYDIILPNNLSQLDITINNKFPILPSKLKHLIIKGTHNITIKNKLQLPLGLTHLNYNVNKRLSNIPLRLTHLIIGYSYGHKLPDLPDNLQELDMRGFNNYKISRLPKNLTHLRLDYFYSQPLPRLPKKLIELKLGRSFNHKLLSIPHTLKRFILGHEFNVHIHIPNDLTHLEVGLYNTLIHILPDRLTHLRWECNRVLPKLPTSLIFLELGSFFNRKISGLPNTLTRLIIENNVFDCRIPTLPSELTHLRMPYLFVHPFPILPNKLIQLMINFTNCRNKDYNYMKTELYQKIMILKSLYQLIQLEWTGDYRIFVLPPNLKSLILEQYNQKLPTLPDSLEYLHLGDLFNQELSTLPPNLKYLNIGPIFNQELLHFPPNLDELILGFNFDKAIIFPNKLTHLEVRSNIQELKFPESLIDLKWYCDLILPPLPMNLQYLQLDLNYQHYFPKLPTKIRRILISTEYKYLHELIMSYGNKVYQ
jgi:hypothetical protein